MRLKAAVVAVFAVGSAASASPLLFGADEPWASLGSPDDLVAFDPGAPVLDVMLGPDAGSFATPQQHFAAIPSPGSAALFAGGSALLLGRRRRAG